MGRHLARYSLAAALATVAALASPALASAGSISGKVTGQTGNALADICVEATNADFTAGDSAETGAAGTYTLSGLPAGSYKVRFTDCGQQNVLGEFWNDKQTIESANTIPVGTSSAVPNINATLATGGRITGTLTNVAGQPLQDICVEANGTADGHFGDARTNAAGGYEIKGLATDSYVLSFSGCGNNFVLDEFYDNAFALEHATPVPVTAGAVAGGKNAVITTGGSIEGTVRDMSGRAIANVCVEAKSTTNVIGTTRTDASGNWAIRMLKAGSYAIRFYDCAGAGIVQEYFRDQTLRANAEMITVTTGSETIGVDANVVRLGSIAGRVTNQSGTAVAGVCVDARTAEQSSSGSAMTAADGTYRITGLSTGSYKVEFSDCSGAGVVDEWWNDKPSYATANSVSVTVGSETGSISPSLAAQPEPPPVPDTFIDSGPTGTIASTQATFTFHGDPSAAVTKYQCALDSGAYSDCTSAFTLTNLGEGSHTFYVRAHNSIDDRDETPAERTFTVDTTPPDTSIATGPSGTTTATTADFTYASTEQNSTFECSLDSGAWANCPASGRSYTGLSSGQHTFQVRAKDAVGNTDQSPASRIWTVEAAPPVDTTPPDTSIADGPSGTVGTNNATFNYSATEPGATFECSIDSSVWAMCPVSGKSYAGLAPGAHTFQVRATDASGNTDETPASRTWTVETSTGPSQECLDAQAAEEDAALDAQAAADAVTSAKAALKKAKKSKNAKKIKKAKAKLKQAQAIASQAQDALDEAQAHTLTACD